MSDLHGHLPEIPDCDLLLVGGDVCPLGSEPGYGGSLDQQGQWLADHFVSWLHRQPADNIIGIAGNHDFVAAEYEAEMRMMPWHYLLDEEITIEGMKIWGSPYSNWLPGWVFMEHDDVLRLIWEQIPDDTNILLTHGPAFLFRDETRRGEHVGSISLAERIRQLKELKLFVFGHIHESYGLNPLIRGYNEETGELEGLPLVNASHVDFPACDPINPPIVVDL